MNVFVHDVFDLVQHAEEIDVRLETILIPALAFAEFKEELERWQDEHPEDMKKLVGLRMVPHYPVVAKYNSVANMVETTIEFYRNVVSDKHDAEAIVYNYFGIDRVQLAEEQALLNANTGKVDAISK